MTLHGTAEVTIVIADDDGLIRMIMRRALAARYGVVLEAGTATECQLLVETRTPDLVITDAHMPGAPIVDRLAEMQRAAPGMPVLVVSGDETLAESSFNFLAKPVELDVLLDAVDRLLARDTETR